MYVCLSVCLSEASEAYIMTMSCKVCAEETTTATAPPGSVHTAVLLPVWGYNLEASPAELGVFLSRPRSDRFHINSLMIFEVAVQSVGIREACRQILLCGSLGCAEL